MFSTTVDNHDIHQVSTANSTPTHPDEHHHEQLQDVTTKMSSLIPTHYAHPRMLTSQLDTWCPPLPAFLWYATTTPFVTTYIASTAPPLRWQFLTATRLILHSHHHAVDIVSILYYHRCSPASSTSTIYMVMEPLLLDRCWCDSRPFDNTMNPELGGAEGWGRLLLAAQVVCDVWDCADMASSFSYMYPAFIYPFFSPVMCLTPGKEIMWLMAPSWLATRLSIPLPPSLLLLTWHIASVICSVTRSPTTFTADARNRHD